MGHLDVVSLLAVMDFYLLGVRSVRVRAPPAAPEMVRHCVYECHCRLF